MIVFKYIFHILRLIAGAFFLLKNIRVFGRGGVVFFDHFYTQDVNELARAFKSRCVAVDVIDSAKVFKGAYLFFDKDVRDLNSRYVLSKGLKGYAFFFFAKFLDAYFRYLFGYRTLILPSDNYYWVREFILISQKNGVTVIVVDKEGMISPYDYEAEAKRILQYAPPVCDAMYVWSDRQHQYWVKAGFDSESIHVLGQPRSDILFRASRNRSDGENSLVLHFTFDDYAYIPPAFVADGVNWKLLKSELAEKLELYAINNPAEEIVVKAHPQQSDFAELKSLFKAKNLKVIGGSAEALALISQARVVIAFQTTAVLEALLMGVPVIYPAWYETNDELEQLLLPFRDAPGINKASSPEHLYSMIADSRISKGDIGADVSSLISSYFFKPDGDTSQRIVDHIIENYR